LERQKGQSPTLHRNRAYTVAQLYLHRGEPSWGCRDGQEPSLYCTSTEESRAGAAGMDRNRAHTVSLPRRSELGLRDPRPSTIDGPPWCPEREGEKGVVWRLGLSRQSYFGGKCLCNKLFRNIFSMFFSSKKEWTAGGTIRKLKTKLNPRAPFAAAHSNIVPLN
jgi:hypothetical protein